MWYTSGSGRIELNITMDQAERGSHPGECEPDILELRKIPAIKRQLAKISPELIAEELREYGAWDNEELKNHDRNLTRILWIACGDIVENKYSKS